MLLNLDISLPSSFSLNIPIPQIEIPKIESPLEFSTDPNFSNITTNFSAGQTVYVRIKSQNDGTTSHELNLRDSNSNIISSITFTKNGDTYSASFTSPADGSYSVEASIKSGGSVVSVVQTIKVGEGTHNNVTIKNEVNTSSSGNSSSSSVSSHISSSESTHSSTPNSKVLGTVSGNVFVRLWESLMQFWDNFWH